MKKFLFYLIILVIIVAGVLYYNYMHGVAPGTINSSVPQPWQPVHLSIPAIQVDAPVMDVGKNAQGLMDAPTSKAVNSPYWTHVFWYAPGVAPGQPGNAVIAGHVDRVGGDPAVFWYLKNLVQGNDVYVTTVDGSRLHFIVDRLVSYPATTSSPEIINTIFGPSTAHHLNFITCNGVWTGSGYDQRLVVFTTQAS